MEIENQNVVLRSASTVGLRVLLVDDDLCMLRLHQFMLERFLVLCVITCVDNVLDAVLQLERETPDLAVIDINMPGIDGFNLLNLLESDARYASVARVVLSGLNVFEIRCRGSLVPNVLAMQKPLDARKLQHILAHLIDHRARTNKSPAAQGPNIASDLPCHANEQELTCRNVLVIEDNPDCERRSKPA